MATEQQKQAFINRIWSEIRGEDMAGFFPSVLIAQAALESNWGQSALAAKYNNYFGIKAGSSWTGQKVNLNTNEVYNGQSVSINDAFRVYGTLIDSIRDRNNLLSSARYASVLTATTPEAQVQAIKNSGYATALNYVSSIMSIINANNLKEFDQLKKKL
jgi:flagellum-specific peptidoglycan hydrolase FlgJ